MTDRRGFTLIELTIVVSIIGLLAGLALPRVQRARHNARAAEIVGAMRAIRIGATIYYDSASAWPANAGAGVVPNRLAGYLPRRGKGIFTGNGWTLRWRTQNVRVGRRTFTEVLLTANLSDENLCVPLARLLAGPSSDVSVACGRNNGTIIQTFER